MFEHKEKTDITHGIKYGGKPLEASVKYFWQVLVTDKEDNIIISPISFFETGLYSNGWDNVMWIKVNENLCNRDGGLSTFRKEFKIKNKEIISAKLYSTALGVYDIFMDGNRIGHLMQNDKTVFDELKPGVADNDKRVYYLANDIKQLLSNSENHVISVSVSSGWWNGIVAYEKRKTTNAFIAQILITYEDGSTETISTDNSWKSTFCGPVMAADIFEGETFDANVDLSYRKTNFNDVTWHDSEKCNEFTGEISAYIGAQVREREDLTLSVKSITIYDRVVENSEIAHGKINIINFYNGTSEILLKKGQTAIYDMGQNFSGVDKIEMSGEKYTVVTLRHSEMLNDNNGLISRGNDGPEGSIYIRNLRGAGASAIYIMNGYERENYSPKHTYFGYRYVEVTATADITIHSLEGKVLTSVLTDTGFISTSNEKVNKLFSNIKWGQYSNYLSMPTDCPQRAERQGWTADTQVFSTAAAYNADSKLFLEKWMVDMRDSQEESGAYPNTAPANFSGGGVFGWADAGVIVPYNLYKMYGDKKSIEDNYESMKKFMDVYMAKTNKNGGIHAFGDWLAYQKTDMNVLSVAYYAWDAQLMAKMADVLGKSEDVKKYNDLYKIEKEYFIELYINDDGSLKNPTQTACLFVLKLHLFPNDESKLIITKQLLENIKSSEDKLQTGFLGTAIILQTLSDIGFSNIAYQLLFQNGLPSWLYAVEQGATTVWERWDSYTKENGFGDFSIDDASFNHYAYGAMVEWMYSYMGGIMYDENVPGFKHFFLKPQPDRLIEKVDCVFDSLYGRIESNWKYKGNEFEYNIIVPANTSTTVYIPADSEENIIVNGKMVSALSLSVDGIEYLKTKDGNAIFYAVSGHFSFSI